MKYNVKIYGAYYALLLPTKAATVTIVHGNDEKKYGKMSSLKVSKASARSTG
jgi:hypothetical protein